MKKFALMIAIAAAVVLTACGGSKTENVQTQAAQASGTAGGPAADAIAESKPEMVVVELPDDYEQQYMEGVVTEYVGNVITVAGDKTMRFDISRNEDDGETPVVRGAYVEVTYADAPADDVYPAEMAIVLNDNEDYAAQEDRDPVMYGTLQFMDMNEVTIMDDAGRTHSFDGAIARKVAFADMKPGDDVIVAYAGSFFADDENGEGSFNGDPVAIKVIAADAVKSDEATANYIDGVVNGIEGGKMSLSIAIDDLVCSGDPAVFAGVEEEQAVRVYYSGPLAALEVHVEKIEQR